MTDHVPAPDSEALVAIPRVPFEGWGRHPVVEGWAREAESLERQSEGAVLSRGLGRAYGDAALPPRDSTRPVVITPRADRILGFDPQTGVLRAEAGLSLGTIRALLLPQGWFTPVSPGTRHVTLGGMVAADIHGKNHHVAGCFGRHVQALRMRVGDGRVLDVTPEGAHAELFHATTGGMGLTGHILEVQLKLDRVASPWIYEESQRCANLTEVIAALGEASADWPMTVAWVDTSARGDKAGRGIVLRGRWATADEAPSSPPPITSAVTFPLDLPSGLVNPWTIGLMNRFWYHRHGAKPRKHVVNPDKYFWPLDGINRWNRAFGRRGFTQYQCVMPTSAALYREFLDIFQKGGGCSFVTVFKDCGEAGPGPLSFPQRGTSMTLDIPLTKDGSTQRLCRTLDEFVVANGGRIYLAKDAFATPETFRQMYPKLPEWQAVRRRYDPELRIRSAQSQRLQLDEG